MKKSLFVFCLLLTASIFAQECDVTTRSYVEIKHRERKGVGYDEGYTSGTIFVTPSWDNCCNQPFLDVRGHAFNDGKFAANVGIGTRYACTECDWAFGGNVYYDYRDVSPFDFHQIGFGLEALSSYLDFRVNGYFPVGSRDKKSNCCFCGFVCHNAFMNQELTVALSNIEGEVGLPITKVFDPVNAYFALGAYYLFEENFCNKDFGSALGGRARVQARIYDGILLGVDATYDKLFRTRIQGYVSLSFPFVPGNMQKEGRRYKERYSNCIDKANHIALLTQPVYRNEIIPIQEDCVCCPILDCNCCPYNFVFVNNIAFGVGNGTAECPYYSLKLAEENSKPGDYIYVFYGNGTTRHNDQGIILQDGQSLVSSATAINLGCWCINPVTPGCLPKISNDTGAGNDVVVSLANNNLVAGFCFDCLGGTDRGISNEASTGGGYVIRDNVIQGCEDPGSSIGIKLDLTNGNCAEIICNHVLGPNTGFDLDLQSGAHATICNNSLDITGKSNNVALNNAAVSVFNNVFLGGSDCNLIVASTDSGAAIVENNSFDNDFGMLLIPGATSPACLRLLNNKAVNGFIFSNFIADPTLFQVEAPNPSQGAASVSEANNGGTVNVPMNPVEYVPLGSCSNCR